MLTIEEVYCNPVVVDEARAKKVQADISYLYRNFNSTLPSVLEAVETIKDTFFEAIGQEQTEDVCRILGLTTTSQAFHIPIAEELPPTPDDTRIAMIIGKPVAAKNKSGTWEVGKEKRYVIALRVVNRSSIHVTKVMPAHIRSVYLSAAGKPLQPDVAKEGDATRAPGTCCQEAMAVGKEVAEKATVFTKQQVDKMVEEACVRFEGLMSGLVSAIGVVEPTQYHHTEIKRMHSLSLPSRCNTDFIEKEVAGMKHTLGINSPIIASPPKIQRQRSVLNDTKNS